MKAQISFKVINDDYNQALADEYHFGKESGNNYKYSSQKTYELASVHSIEIINTGVYDLKGELENGQFINTSIPNIKMFRFHLENGTIEDYGVSRILLSKTHQTQNEKYNIIRCYFYLNAEPQPIEFTNGLYLSKDEILKIIETPS
jgi:hypothetical protein